MKVVMVYHGSYSDYSESWIYVDESIELSKEVLIKAFLEAKRLQDLAWNRYSDQFAKILIKHGRRDLVSGGIFGGHSAYAIQRKVSDELSDALNSLEDPSYAWEDYLLEATAGKIRPIKPDLTFEFDIYSYERFEK